MVIAGSLLVMGAAGCETEHVYGVYGNGDYDYFYYPEAEVYYAPSVNLYYWRDHDSWRHDRVLPRSVRIERDRHVDVRLHTNQPWTMHDQVRREHPRNH